MVKIRTRARVNTRVWFTNEDIFKRFLLEYKLKSNLILKYNTKMSSNYHTDIMQ